MTSLDSLFVKYLKYRFNWETIFIEDIAFCVYHIQDNLIELKHFHIDQKSRKRGIFRQLIEILADVAYNHKCRYVVTSVNIKTPQADRHIKNNLLYGMKPYYLRGNEIWFKKELNHEAENPDTLR